MLKPHGFVLATGLLTLVSKTAAHVFECLRLRLAPNRKMSLLQELLSVLRTVDLLVLWRSYHSCSYLNFILFSLLKFKFKA